MNGGFSSNRLVRRLLILSWAANLFVAAAEVHADKAINTSFANGLAIGGYDVVAYFVEGKAREGRSDFSHRWMGEQWHFLSPEHRDVFIANPLKYAPQYGGHCAWAVSQGYVHTVDPEAWTIVDGKLYLNYSKSIQAGWRRDRASAIARADANWPKLQSKLRQ